MLFFIHLMIFLRWMTLKLKSTTNELWKGWNLAWYHHFTHIECVQKLVGLWQKLDALRVQTRPSPSKYKGFRRKLICYKGISFFKTYFNSRLFVHSICTIQSHILKFQTFLTSFGIFHAFNDLFWLFNKVFHKLVFQKNSSWNYFNLKSTATNRMFIIILT